MQFTIATPTRSSSTATRTSRNPLASPARRIWTAQVVLGAIFLFAGGAKLVTPPDTLAEQAGYFPVEFFYFIGVCEFLGGLGVVLPRALHIREGLTPLAAAGLAIIMAGATILTAFEIPLAAIPPFVIGLLAVYVAVNRGRDYFASRA